MPQDSPSQPPPTISSQSPPQQPQLNPSMPPVVYGELSILGYNGYIPNCEKSGRRSKSKFLLCQRLAPNGIKKSRHYIVKQPQATKAIQDKELHSISYTFSRSQTIIVEYKQDEKTDMFQIGRSSEDPIDFVVMDTLPANCNDISSSSNQQHHEKTKHSSSSSRHQHQQEQRLHNQHHHHHHHLYNENASGSQHQQQQQQLIAAGDLMGLGRLHRHLAKVGEEMLQYGFPAPGIHDPRGRLQMHHMSHGQPQAVLLNYPQPNISNLPPMMANHFRNQGSSMSHHHHSNNMATSNNNHPTAYGGGPSSQQQQQQLLSSARSNHLSSNQYNNNSSQVHSSNHHNNTSNNGGSSHNNSTNIACKRSHATQSTISRFACRILIDREPPYTARIYAAGFDSSKNIFLGEKATKWEQNNSIDGLTTNGILLMHPRRGNFYEDNNDQSNASQLSSNNINNNNNNSASDANHHDGDIKMDDSDESHCNDNNDGTQSGSRNDSNNNCNNNGDIEGNKQCTKAMKTIYDSGTKEAENRFEMGGVWREVSVDGGMYAIRESRSAIQKGTRIESETNILQDGTLIDLCGATLLWRSVDGFKASPTKKSLEEKIDMLNASRPQCPVGLNTLVIPRKPILPNNHANRIGSDHHHNHSHHHHEHRHGHGHGSHSHHHQDRDHPSASSSSANVNNNNSGEKSGQQPYIYLKCGHVQGYHDWGTTEKSNQRTCPICLSVGTVAKLSMGLEPSFYVDSGPLTHVFNPCGHMASERTVKYWCSIKIPHGTHFFHSICPFCATPLAANEPASTKLIFQDDLD